MSQRIRLILTLHNHQPIGNFDGVFEEAYRDSYAPFLELLEEFPEIPVVLHNSGCLLEWLVEEHPEYVDRLRALVQRGQVELLGGPFYEPILACIPRRDRVGQISLYRRFLEKTFGTKIRGMWMPERVWEQGFTADIAAAGIEYTLLDDMHFRNAGLSDEQLHGYHLTEDDGQLLKVFAGSERLRYLIPYADPEKVIAHVREVAEKSPNAVLVFGDDGEKFGVWPGSKELVYGKGWLRRFFQMLRENQHWLKITTLAETVDHVSPEGRIYLPDSSYREMTEWALPSERQTQYKSLVERQSDQPDWPQLKPFVRAGFWRNFLVKYPEANEMYCRMLQVSQRLQQLSATDAAVKQADKLSEARKELYRAQCNCPYWHGAFGGLYLPHLRNAIYSKLIAADTLLEAVAGRNGSWVAAEAEDFNNDARKEVLLASDRLVAYLAPSKGGHLYEFDVRSIGVNLLATLNRRPEPYHDKIRQHAGRAETSSTGGGVDPNGGVCFKQPDLDQKLIYDAWPRKSLVDHFLQPALPAAEFRAGRGRIGDFTEGVYQTVLKRAADRVDAKLWRDGRLGPYSVRVNKTISLDRAASTTLQIRYELERLPAGLPIHFGVEFNFAAMPAGAADRYFYDERGRHLGELGQQLDLPVASRLGLVDEWLGIDLDLDLSEPAGIWTMPIQTVSQSESGFELVHQSCSVTPHWQFIAPDNGQWSVTIQLSCDTSAALARRLADAAPAAMSRLVRASV